MRKVGKYIIAALFSMGLTAQAEQIIDGDFSAGSNVWKTVSQAGSSVTITNGVASFDDSGDTSETSHKQALYQNFAAAVGSEVSFSYDFRLDEGLNKAWRISLYETNNNYDSQDVFRSNITLGAGQWRYVMVSSGVNKTIDMTASVSTGDWVRVSGSIDLIAGTCSGSVSNTTTAAAIGSWANKPLHATASQIRGFAVYDTAGNTVASDISVDNVSVAFVPSGAFVADATTGDWNDASVWSNGVVPGVSGSAEPIQVNFNNGANVTLQSGTDVLIGEPTQILAVSLGQEDFYGHNILTINGGTLTAGKTIAVGNSNTSTGTLNMVSGSLTTAGHLFMGNAGNDGISTLNMTGGSVSMDNLEFRSANGVVNYGGGSMIIAGDLESNTHSDPGFIGELNYTALSPSMNPLVVSNNVILSDLILGLALDAGYTPTLGDTNTLVEYAGTLTDTFVGLAEAATVDVGGTDFTLNYAVDLGDGRSAITLVAVGDAPFTFGDFSNQYALVEGPDGDDDDDEVSNLYEFGLNGNPTNSADVGEQPDFQIVEDTGTNYLEYVHIKRLNSGLDYYLETTPSLVPSAWTNDGYSAVEGADRGDGFSVVTNLVSTEVLDAQFVRLIIEEE